MLSKNRKTDEVIQVSKKTKRIRAIFLALFILILLGVVGFLAYNYINMQREIKYLKDPKVAQELAQKQIQDVVKNVGKHMILPTNEEPTFASITDINALKKEQPFYEGAENGDQILIYKLAKIGIVYSPSKDRIVKVGPVFVEGDSTNNTTANNDIPSN